MKPSTAITRTLMCLSGRALALAALLASHSVQAATQYAAGTFTWDNGTTPAWAASSGGSYTTVWTSGNDAVFEGTAGTVSIAAAGATAHNLTFNTTGYLIQSNSLTLNGSTPTISLDTGISGTISSIIAGSAGLTKSGAGMLTLSGASTYTGGTTVSAGTLTTGIASTRSGTTITNGATGKGNVTLAGGVTEKVNSDATWYAPQVTLQGDLTLEGNFRQTVGFATLDLNGGTRTIYINPTGGNIKQTIPGNTALEGTGRNRWEMGADVGAMTVQNGTLVLASNLTGNDYAGFMFRDATSFTSNLGVTVGSNVFLQTNTANSLGSTTANTPKLTVNGIWGLLGSAAAGRDQTIYSLAGSGRVYASLTSANVNSRAITINGTAGSTEFSGELSNGPGTATLSIVKNGASTQTFSGPNTYTGATTVSGGTLKLGNTKALGFGGFIAATFTGTTTVSSGYTLDLNGAADISEPITLNGTGIGANGALVNNSGTPASIGSGIAAAQVSGAGSGYSAVPAVSISGTGSGATATASLGVTTASFTLATTGDKVYSANPGVTISGGGGSGAAATPVMTGGKVTGITVTAAGTGYTSAPTLVISGGTATSGTTTSTFTGDATHFCVGGIAMTAAGSGYTGTPTYTFGSGNATPGTMTLSSVALASASSIGGSGDITIATPISGAFALTKVGAGTLTLSGSSSYGATTVSAGTLLINGTKSGTGAVTVAVDATFGGTGSIGGNVTYLSGALAKFTQGSPLTITGTLGLSNNVVHLVLPDSLGAGTYPLAHYTNSGSTGTFATTPVIDSGSLAFGGTASVATAGGTVTLTVLVNVPGMDHFAISEITSPQTAGTAITGITITAQDAGNATVTGFTGTVTFGGSAGVTGTSGTFTAGVLSDVSVMPTVAGGDLTFTVDDGFSHTGSTTLTTIQPGTPNKLAFTTSPGGGTAGSAWTTQPVVTVQDAYGNTVTGSSASITLAKKAGTGPGTLSGTKTVSATDSVAVFSDLSIDKTGAGYQLSATSAGLAGTDSPAFSITAAAAATLTVSGFPGSQPAGQSAGVTVTARDAYGNTATGYTGTVSLTSSSDPLATFASNPYTFLAPDNGVKTLTATLKTVGTQSITATDTVTGTITGTQTGIAVTATPPISTFTTPGTSTWTAPVGVTSVQLLVVAGGGGAGVGGAAGGGGAGGLLYYGSEAGAVASSYAVTPGTTYNITVGAGGATHTNGGNSAFDAVTAVGGGAGGSQWGAGAAGGSGGGSDVAPWGSLPGGAGTAGQGHAGGASQGGGQAESAGGGGGGAGSVGAAGHNLPATGTKGQPGNGGDGLTFSISGAAVAYAGGGGGAFFGDAPYTGLIQGVAGTGATGPGGGGTAVYPSGSTAGKNGIVIVSFSSSGTPFGDWIGNIPGVPSGQTGFNDDPNNDGVPNGLAWILLGGAPMANSLACLPAPTTSAGALTLEFTCLKPSELGDATFEVQYSNDLGVGDLWHAAAVPATSTTVNTVVFTVTEYDATHNHVIATIPSSAAAGGKLFSRLHATLP